eukprot:TRINITY_DN1432_c0_g1_i2.p1 TRINITY_DN1432_c0_g1~~TRINITY_DN1432_c0_g1_i2.p1  ORF type:complete len:235 (-),score=74.12 TRINITY_DN1432_c0_g1_i2:38-742(-)
MDPIKKEKHRAMRKYKRARFVQNLFQYCLTAYVFGLFLSEAFPSLFRALKYFICVSLPNIGASLVGPKCLFILCNMIVIFLAHESKLFTSPPSSPTPEIQEEYVKFSRRPRRPSTNEEKEERKLEVSLVKESVEMIGLVVEEDKKDKEEEQELEEERKEAAEQEEEETQAEQEEEEEEDKGAVDVGGKEEHELPADELNRRSEDLIQRVHKQRRLEVQMMECGGWKEGKETKTP